MVIGFWYGALSTTKLPEVWTDQILMCSCLNFCSHRVGLGIGAKKEIKGTTWRLSQHRVRISNSREKEDHWMSPIMDCQSSCDFYFPLHFFFKAQVLVHTLCHYSSLHHLGLLFYIFYYKNYNFHVCFICEKLHIVSILIYFIYFMYFQ